MAATLEVRPTRAADLAYVQAAEQHPDNVALLLPWTGDEHRAALDDPNVRHLLALAGGTRVGFAIVVGAANAHRSLELRRMVVTEKGHGFGRALLRHAAALALRELGAHRLWLDTQTRNRRARALYASEGFVEEGVLRECWLQDGRYRSLVVMSMLEQEFAARSRRG